MVIDHSEMSNINLPDVQQGWRSILCTQTELDVQLFPSCLSTVRSYNAIQVSYSIRYSKSLHCSMLTTISFSGMSVYVSLGMFTSVLANQQ